MARITLLYSGAAGATVNQIAGAVGTHLNYLGVEKDEVRLSDVSEVIIEHIDESLMPTNMSEELIELAKINGKLTSMFRAKFVHQKIINVLISEVYEKIGHRIRMISGKYSEEYGEIKEYTIKDLLHIKKEYDDVIEKRFIGILDLEKNIKHVFEQVALEPINDLALSQTEGFTRVDARLRKIMSAMGIKDDDAPEPKRTEEPRPGIDTRR